MRFLCAFLSVLVLSLQSSAAETSEGATPWYQPGALWTGNGAQPSGQSWTIEIEFSELGIARIAYPSIPCSGSLTPRRLGESGGVFTETITRHPNNCTNDGKVTLELSSSRKIDFTHEAPDGRISRGSVSLPSTSGEAKPSTESPGSGQRARGNAPRERFPELFATLSKMQVGSEVLKAGATQAVEDAILLIEGLTKSTALSRELDVEAADFVEHIKGNPVEALGLSAAQAGKAVTIGVASEAVAGAVTETIFSSPALDDVPDVWLSPLEMLVEATIAEGIGLVESASNPTPLTLVGPVIDRIQDGVEIYRASQGVAEAQNQGLYQVAVSSELFAKLLVDVGTERARQLVEKGFQSTIDRLDEMVGHDDATEVALIFEHGLHALTHQKLGETAAARERVASLREIGDAEEGPFLLSAEGPIDLLTKLAAGEDAPKAAARIMVSATSLGTLVEPTAETETTSDPVGETAQTTPATTIQTNNTAESQGDGTEVTISAQEGAWYNRVVPDAEGVSGYGHGAFPSRGQATHAGVDISELCGLAVRAPADGEVVARVTEKQEALFEKLGNALAIRHGAPDAGRPIRTIYAHLAAPPAVDEGPVARGTRLGKTGQTGLAESCHVHFEARRFSGWDGFYHPTWRSLFGPGDWSGTRLFQEDWVDPQVWIRGLGDDAGSSNSGTPDAAVTTALPTRTPMEERFADACAAAGDETGDYACPYREVGECAGEGCYDAGVVRVRAETPLRTRPGAERVATRMSAGQYGYMRTADTFLVPCRSTVRSGISEVASGTTAYRLGYRGEGTYAYRTEVGERFQSLLAADIVNDAACSDKSETWIEVVTESGTTGWARPENFDGVSIHTFAPAPVPDWVRSHIEDPDRYFVQNADAMCTRRGRAVANAALTEKLFGKALRLRYPTGKVTSYYPRPIGDRRQSIVEAAGGRSVSGETRIREGGRFCTTYDGQDGRFCGRIAVCRSGEGAYVILDQQWEERLLVEETEVSGRAREAWLESAAAERHAEEGLVGDHLMAVAWRDLQECVRSEVADLHSCLSGRGYSDPVLEDQVSLVEEYDIGAVVGDFVELGRVDFAEVVFTTRANSHHQDMLANIDGADAPLTAAPGNIDIASHTDNAEVRRIFRVSREAFIDRGRARLHYYRWQPDGTAHFYYNAPIVDGCRACEILGSVAWRVDFKDGRYTGSEPVHWQGPTDFVEGGVDTDANAYQNNTWYVQSTLNKAGYAAGPIDNAWGPKTESAVRAFQFKHCLPATGELDDTTAAALADMRSLWGGCYEQ